MPNEIRQKRIVLEADWGFGTNFANLDSLGDGQAAQSDAVTGLEKCERLRNHFRLKTGTTAGGIIKFYRAAASDHTSEIRDGDTHLGTTSAKITVAADVDELEEQLQLVHAFAPTQTATVYEGHFDIWYPSDDEILVVVNDSGAALDGTGSPHRLQRIGFGPEVQ